MKTNTDGQSQKEGDNLILSNATRKQPDADVARRKQQQTKIAANHSSIVDVSKLANGEIVRQSTHQRNGHQYQASQKLTPNNLAIRYSFGDQQFNRARAVFFSDHAHGNGRNKEKQRPKGYAKKHLQSGLTDKKDI